jgi:hypothetical protein
MFYSVKIRLSLLHAPPLFLERSTGLRHAQKDVVLKAFLKMPVSWDGPANIPLVRLFL